MKYINIFFISLVALVTVMACIAGMTVLFDDLSKPGLAWYDVMSIIIGNCFLGYFGLLTIYLCINYITLKMNNK
jgi:hypothetical protein